MKIKETTAPVERTFTLNLNIDELKYLVWLAAGARFASSRLSEIVKRNTGIEKFNDFDWTKLFQEEK